MSTLGGGRWTWALGKLMREVNQIRPERTGHLVAFALGVSVKL
jgi:hypothetical protein